MRQMQGGTATMQWSVMPVLLSLCLIPGVLVGQEAERNPARPGGLARVGATAVAGAETGVCRAEAD